MEFPLFYILVMLALAGGMYYGNVVFKKQKKPWGKTCTIGCAFAIIVLTIYLNLVRSPVNDDLMKLNQQYQTVQATVLANKLANMYSGKGKCLVIHQPIYNPESGHGIDHILEGFKEGFQNRVTEIRPVPIRQVTIGPNGMTEEEASEFTAEDFNKVIKENPDCDMLVILVPLPHKEEELFEVDPFVMIEDPEKPGKWIRDPKRSYPLVGVFQGFIGNSEELFHDNLLGAMTLWKPDPTIDEEPLPKDLDEAFNKRYLMITQSNIDAVKSKHPLLFPAKKKKK